MTDEKKLLSVCVIVIFFIALIAYCTVPEKSDIPKEDTVENSTQEIINETVNGDLTIHFLDIGEADCIILSQNNEYMIIDAGNENNEETIKKYISSLNINTFKYAIATHPHNNHIGSMDYIVDTYNIEKLYLPEVTATTKAYTNLIDALNSKKMYFTTPKVGETFYLGQAECTILAPNGITYEDINNYSIVIKVVFGDNSFLFTGDAEDISENEMLLNKYNLSADLIKIGNSGSRTSTTKEFLNTVNPRYAVISVGSGNQYNYPHEETLSKLNENNVKVYRTDLNGTIIVTSDGKKINFTTKR